MSHTQQDDVVYTDEPSDNSDSRAVSDQVMALASSMLAELQRVMDTYQIESRDFAQLTSLVTSTLEELDFALSEKSKATAQLEQMEEETSQLFLRLTEEREARHAADERYITLEDSAGAEKRKLEGRVQQLDAERRQLTSRIKNKEDHVSRLEEDREETIRQYKEKSAKDREAINRYLRQIEQLKAMEEVRNRSSSIIAQKRQRSSSALAAKGDEKKESSSLAKEGSSEVATATATATTKGPGSIALDVPTDKTRPWKTELFSPTTEQMSESPVVGSSIPVVGSIAEESAAEAMREEMDKEDEERFAAAAATTTTTTMTEKEDQRNAMTLSEELGMTTGQSEVTVVEEEEEEEAETNEVEEGDDFFHSDEINRLRNEKEEVENQRLQLALQKAELSHKVDNLESDIANLQGELEQKETNIGALEKTTEELRADLKQFREERMSPEEGYRRSKSGQRLRYTKTELDTVLKQYHFYKEKTHDLEAELRRVKADAAAAIAARKPSGIKKFFSKLFGIKTSSSASPPRRSAPRNRQQDSKPLAMTPVGGSPTRMPIDPDSYVITNSWKVGHGGIIDPTAPPLPQYHSNVAVPEAGVRLQSVVSVCCPSEPVSSLDKLSSISTGIFLWLCTISKDEASQIHVVDVTLPSRPKVVENFLVSDSRVPSMEFVPTVALKNVSKSLNSPEKNSPEKNSPEKNSPEKNSPEKNSPEKNAENEKGQDDVDWASDVVAVQEHPLMDPKPPKERGHVASTFFHSSVWVGTESGWIYVYSTVADPGRQLLVEDMANSVRCIKFFFDAVFAGIGDGTLAVFRSSSSACCGWDLTNHKRIPLESKSLVAQTTCLASIDGQLWAGCGNMINIVNPETLQLETAFTASQRLSAEVTAIAGIGDVVCVSVAQSPNVYLFHARSIQPLQDVDVSPLCNIIDKEMISPIHPANVTCMMAVNGLLWVGTASGVVLTLDFSNPTITHRSSRQDVLEIRARRTRTPDGAKDDDDGSGEASKTSSPPTLSPTPNADGYIEVLGSSRRSRGPVLPSVCSYGDARMSCFGHLNGVNSFVGVRRDDIDLTGRGQPESSPFDGDDGGGDVSREYGWIFSGGFGFVDLYLENVDERRARRRTSTLMQTKAAASRSTAGQSIDVRYDSQQFLFWRL